MSDKPSRYPWPLIIMLVIFITVLLPGFLLRPQTEEDKLRWIERLGTTNQGMLLNPVIDLVPSQILDSAGQFWPSVDDHRWALIVAVEGPCLPVCIERIEELARLKIRLNRKANRLQIGILEFLSQNLEVPTDAGESVLLERLNIERLSLLIDEVNEEPNEDLHNRLNSTNMPALGTVPVVLMVNPANQIMMAYDAEHSGNQILEDLKHLLALSE